MTTPGIPPAFFFFLARSESLYHNEMATITGPVGCCCGGYCGPAVAPATLTVVLTSNCSLLNGQTATLPLVVDTGTTRQWSGGGTIAGCPCDHWTMTVTCTLVSGVPQWTVSFTISGSVPGACTVGIHGGTNTVTVTSSDPIDLTYTDNKIGFFGDPTTTPAYCCTGLTLSAHITS